MRFVIRKCEKSGRRLRNCRRSRKRTSLLFIFLDRISAAPKKLTKRSSIIIFVPVCAIELCRVVTNGEGRKGNRRRSRVYILVEEKQRERVILGTDVRWGQGGERGRILTRSGQITAPINYLRLRGLRDPRFDRAMGEEYSYFHDDISSMFVIKTDGNNPPKKKRF